MTTVLFVRPSHDDVTSYLYHYSKELLEDSKFKGFRTINKEKGDANKKVIIPIIEKNNPNFIMFNGHGNTSLICGHNDEFLVKRKFNHDLLKKRITYSLTCSSAAELGKEIGDDNSTFIGYIDDFALGMDIQCQTTIHRDKRARLFLDPSNLLVKSLLKGNPAEQAVKKAKESMRKNIFKLRTDPFPDAKDYIPYLFNNYMILKVLGNNKAKI
ncbi:MAG: hypothetical protein ABIG89_01360 [Candidatus Woesearchaeota archaeon]